MRNSSPILPRGGVPIAIGAVVFCGLFGAATGCKRAAPVARSAAGAAPVYVQAVRAHNVPVFVESFGSLSPYRTVGLAPQVSGVVQAVEFADGSTVKAGQVLYRIDQDMYQAMCDRARANVESQQSALALARDRLQRSGTLGDRNMISKQDFDALRAAVTQAQAMLAGFEADLVQAKLNLDRAVVRAPMAGVIGINQQHVGNLVSAQQSQLVTLKQIDPILIDFSISGPDVARLLTAVRATPRPLKVVASLSGEFKHDSVEGELEVVDTGVDVTTGMLKLRGRLPNRGHVLWPGQFARARLILGELASANLVDRSAVMIGADGPYLFVVKEGKTAELRNVKLGDREDELIVITEGVQPGEVVVVQGQLNLKHGAPVRVVTPAAAVAANP